MQSLAVLKKFKGDKQLMMEANMRLHFLFQIVLFSLLGPSMVSSQTIAYAEEAVLRQEAGLPIIQNFKPIDYQILPQTSAIIQDHCGVMYFGNNAGVLEYDSANLRTIVLSRSSTAFSLALSEHGEFLSVVLTNWII